MDTFHIRRKRAPQTLLGSASAVPGGGLSAHLYRTGGETQTTIMFGFRIKF